MVDEPSKRNIGGAVAPVFSQVQQTLRVMGTPPIWKWAQIPVSRCRPSELMPGSCSTRLPQAASSGEVWRCAPRQPPCARRRLHCLARAAHDARLRARRRAAPRPPGDAIVGLAFDSAHRRLAGSSATGPYEFRPPQPAPIGGQHRHQRQDLHRLRMAQALSSWGRCGVIGTLGVGEPGGAIGPPA
jgi:hypothetical protein